MVPSFFSVAGRAVRASVFVALGKAAAAPMAWALFALLMGLPLWCVGVGLLRHVGGMQQLMGQGAGRG